METFLAVYVGSGTSGSGVAEWNALDADTRREREEAGMQAWGDWMAANESCIVHAGGPVGRTKRISRAGVADVTNDLTGFVVFQAESHEAAAAKFEGHPHFTIFPGEAVEVMPCLPIPGA